MIRIILLLPFFNNLYCMHCMYNVVVVIVVEINLNSIQNTYLNTIFFVFVLKITKGCIFVFDIWSVFEKYLQIQSNTHKHYHFTNKR